MSIYGPPPREPRRAPGVVFTFVRFVIVVVGLGALACVAVFAALDLQRSARKQLEIEHARTPSHEGIRLQTADFLPAIPEPPNIELPPSLLQLQAGHSLPPAPPLQLQSAELLPPAPPRTQPEPLQTAEILH